LIEVFATLCGHILKARLGRGGNVLYVAHGSISM
jgi:hypothetical protein